MHRPTTTPTHTNLFPAEITGGKWNGLGWGLEEQLARSYLGDNLGARAKMEKVPTFC